MPLRRKVALLIPDGAADMPLDQLGGKTPLEAAYIPNMDEVAALGATGTIRSVPQGMLPGSDVANLSILGYDPRADYRGRGPIEAASLGVVVPPGWTVFRCNLVSADEERMLDYSAGHVGQAEAAELIQALQQGLGDDETRFYQGNSYRNLLLIKGDYEGLECTPPHDITGELIAPHMPVGQGADRVIELVNRSRKIFADLSVKDKLEDPGKPGVNMIWLWGQGAGMELEPFEKRFGLKGGVISAVDLVNGLGLLAGLHTIEVPGITGFLDTNYIGKGEAAVNALGRNDFVYVHVEAPDEASHMGNIEEKVKALERFDLYVVKPVLQFLRGHGDFRLLVCPDHLTLISTRTHDGTAVPYAACGTGILPGGAHVFCEKEARERGPHFEQGWKLMSHLAGVEPWPGSEQTEGGEECN